MRRLPGSPRTRRSLALALLALAGLAVLRGTLYLREGETVLVAKDDGRLVIPAPGLRWVGFAPRPRLPSFGPGAHGGARFSWQLKPFADWPPVELSGRYALAPDHPPLPLETVSPRLLLERTLRDSLPGAVTERVRLTHDPRRLKALRQALVQAAHAAWFELRDLTLSWPDPEARLAGAVDDAVRHGTSRGRPVVLVGVDGLDPRVVEDLLRAGLMPNWSELAKRGVWGALRSHEPKLSPLLWTSLATGLRPHQHGILDFVGAQGCAVPSTCRTARPVWAVAGEAGLEVAVVNWWASHPVQATHGTIVSDLAVRSHESDNLPTGALLPAEAAERLELARPARAELDAALATLLRRDPRGLEDPRLGALTAALADTLTTCALGLDLLRSGSPDLTMLYLGLPDQAAHLFIEEMPPRLPGVQQEAYRSFGGVVHGSYLLLDSFLGQLVRELPASAALLVVSDHGFVYGEERLRLGHEGSRHNEALHATHGVYLFAGEPFTTGVGPGLDLYDVTPLMAALAGLPLAEDLAGRLPMEVTRSGLPAPPRLATWQHPRRHAGWPPLALDGVCGDASGAWADKEWMQRLRALGYLGGSDEAGWEPFLARRNLSRSFLEAGLAEEAALAALAALELRPADGQAAWDLIAARLAQGDHQQALARARELAADETSELRGPAGLVAVELLVREERLAEASEQARALGPASGWEASLARGIALEAVGQDAAAMSHYAEALRHDPVRALDALMAWQEASRPQAVAAQQTVARLVAGLSARPLLEAAVPALPPDPRLAGHYRSEAEAARDAKLAWVWLRRAAAFAPSDVKLQESLRTLRRRGGMHSKR